MVFKQKLDDQGLISRYKARRVVKRFFQKEGIDYLETFASVVSFHILLLLVGKFISKGWHVHHANISPAFLNGDIDGDLFVSWPDVAYQFKKILYGLRQSPPIWYEKLNNLLQGFGFKQFTSYE